MTEHHADRAHPEQVVLEIGDELGALVVYTDPELHGSEIEISPGGQDDRRSHKDVINRPFNGRATYAAVFDRLPQGSYTLWTCGVAAARDVAVAGAAVTELDWRRTTTPSPIGTAHRS
ncbi:MAG: phospholipase [Gaiellales bacterium]